MSARRQGDASAPFLDITRNPASVVFTAASAAAPPVASSTQASRSLIADVQFDDGFGGDGPASHRRRSLAGPTAPIPSLSSVVFIIS